MRSADSTVKVSLMSKSWVRNKLSTILLNYSTLAKRVLWCFVHVCFVQNDNFEHCLALPIRWRALVRTLYYWYLVCDPRKCDNSRKVCTPRRVSASGAPHVVPWTKQTWIKHHNTVKTGKYNDEHFERTTETMLDRIMLIVDMFFHA